MRFGGGEFSTGTMRNFQPELTLSKIYSELLMSETAVQIRRDL
jgi:hypothetical protein